MTDYQARFGVGKIALLCDRGIVSEQNLGDVAAAGFDHVLATRLHHDEDVAAVLEEAAATGEGGWTKVSGAEGTSCCEVTRSGRRFVVVFCEERKSRDDRPGEELLARTEERLITLADRVRTGKLVDPAKIGAAADRIVRDSGVARCCSVTIRHSVSSWRFDEEKLFAGRYVFVTSLSAKEASATDVVRHYRMLQAVERRCQVMKDLLAVRPVCHRTEDRVRAHISLCVIAAMIEAVMGDDLEAAQPKDPNLPAQNVTLSRALAELGKIRRHHLHAGRGIKFADRPDKLQRQILDAFRVEDSTWGRAKLS
jgi:hypothetical protein